MFKRILVPTDGSDTANKALTAALQLGREQGARVRVVHSFDAFAYLTGYEQGPEILQQARVYGEKVLQDALDIAASAGVPADGKLVEVSGQRLGEEIAQQAIGFEADLIVVGTHGRRGIGRVLLGSGAEQIIRLAPVPALVIRAEDRQPSH